LRFVDLAARGDLLVAAGAPDPAYTSTVLDGRDPWTRRRLLEEVPGALLFVLHGDVAGMAALGTPLPDNSIRRLSLVCTRDGFTYRVRMRLEAKKG